MTTRFLMDTWVLPDGMEVSDPNMRYFALSVSWRGTRSDTGRGGWSVSQLGLELSTAGNWYPHPQPYQQRHYRWEHRGDALDAAEAAVNDFKMNGRTWAEWEARS